MTSRRRPKDGVAMLCVCCAWHSSFVRTMSGCCRIQYKIRIIYIYPDADVQTYLGLRCLPMTCCRFYFDVALVLCHGISSLIHRLVHGEQQQDVSDSFGRSRHFRQIKMKISLYILSLLSMQLRLVQGTVNSNVQSIHVRKIWFSRSLVNLSFQFYFGMPFIDCVKTCTRIRKCKSVSYTRNLKFCELNYADEATNSDALVTTVGAVFSPKSDWSYKESEFCASCLDNDMCTDSGHSSCDVYACPSPNPLKGATVLGNRFYVGSKRLYKCGNGAQEVSVCQADGNWSSVTTTCSKTCEPLVIENASVDITEIAETGAIEANVICDNGYFHRGLNKVYCNAASLEWENVEQVGCIKIYVEPWTIVYRLLGGMKTNVQLYSSWKNQKQLNSGDFRNGDLMSSWNERSIKQVKVDLTGYSDEPGASLIFDGTGTDYENWFSAERLIDSSWTDLTNGSVIEEFSIKGVNLPGTGYLRWTVLNVSGNSNTAPNCSADLVWLAIARAQQYPCDKSTIQDDIDGRMIVYSKLKNGATWDGGNLGLAKDMTVSVLLED